MLIYDDIFHWDGWGGKLRLASGKCLLRIFDLVDEETRGITILKPVIVIVSDIAKQKVSVRSCAGHIATMVVSKFDIDHNRMFWVEHYPASQYGAKDNVRNIPERFDMVEFTWNESRAFKPKWRPLTSPVLDVVKELMEKNCF